MTEDTRPFVSIVMPALNEERYISAAIASILPATDTLDYELLVVDGGSSDRTRALVEQMAISNPRIRLLVNPKRIQAAAVNLAAVMADPRAGCFVRADCHLHYPAGFVERCLRSLTATGAASVVVPMHTEGVGCMQRAVAAAQNSRLGNGGAAHRSVGRSGFVEHGHHAAFDRQTFLDLGGYDEQFSHNEDGEYDTRLIRSGRKIYLDAEAAVTYYPRASLRPLAKQYYFYGRGRASTLLKHRALPRLRQMLPVAALLGCLLSISLTTLNSAYLGIAALYLGACIFWGIVLAVRHREICLVFSGIAAIVMHMSWATGFLVRIGKRALAGR